MQMILKHLAIATVSVGLIGCGGGDSSPDPDPGPGPVDPGVKLEVEFLEKGVHELYPQEVGHWQLVKNTSEFAQLPPVVSYGLPGYPGFQEPDYTKNYLLYLEHKPILSGERYAIIGITSVESNPDGTAHTIHADFCVGQGLPGSVPDQMLHSFSIYRTSLVTGTIEVRWTERERAEACDNPQP